MRFVPPRKILDHTEHRTSYQESQNSNPFCTLSMVSSKGVLPAHAPSYGSEFFHFIQWQILFWLILGGELLHRARGPVTIGLKDSPIKHLMHFLMQLQWLCCNINSVTVYKSKSCPLGKNMTSDIIMIIRYMKKKILSNTRVRWHHCLSISLSLKSINSFSYLLDTKVFTKSCNKSK